MAPAPPPRKDYQLSNKRKTRTSASRPVPSSGKSVLIPGLGYFKLPDTLAGLEQWRQGYRNTFAGDEHLPAMDAITDVMADAITAGHSTVDDADIDGMVIIHRPDGTDAVAHVRDIARDTHDTEAGVWEAIDELVNTGLFTPCADDDSDNACADGGYRMTGTGAEASQLWASLHSATTERTGH
jgi:hypothetical protein